MDKNNSIIPFNQSIQLSKVANSLAITNKILAKPEIELVPYRKGNKWGYSTKDKKIVVDCEFDYTFRFSDGIGKVKKNGRYGYIDLSGNLITEIKFRNANKFNEGFARVAPSKLINKTGEFVFEDKDYEAISNFHNGFAAIEINSKLGFINYEGNLVIPPIYENDSYDVIRDESEMNLNEANYNNKCKFSDGLISLKKEGKYGILNTKGETIVPFEYEYIGDFHDSLAVYFDNRKLKSEFDDYRRGYLNKNGNIKIPPIYNSRYNWKDFSEGLAFVQTKREKFFINVDNEIVIPPQNYNFFGKFSEGLCPIYISKGFREPTKKGFINREGTIIIEPEFDRVWDFSNGLAGVQKDIGKSGFINSKGEIVIEFEENVSYKNFIDGLTYCSIHHENDGDGIHSSRTKYGFMDVNGIKFWEE